MKSPGRIGPRRKDTPLSDDNVFDLFGDPNEDEDETTEGYSEDEAFDADPGTVAFMDQETAAFNAAEHEFADRYGFVHKCRCDQDYTEGNLVSVTECYANMTTDALEACATLYAENKLLRVLITKAMGDNGGMAVPESEHDANVFGDDGDDDGNDTDRADGFA